MKSKIFDTSSWPVATNLSWARTILHESIHAYLSVYFALDRPGWIASYPQMVEEWGRINNWNDVHHEEIARSLVQDIALSLKDYGDSKGYNLPVQFYEDLSWGGLQNTSTFNSLTNSEKNRILNVIAVELTGKDLNSQNKSQKGSPSNC